MTTTTDITQLGTVSANNAQLLAQVDGKMGYINGIFNDEGKLKEVADLATKVVDSDTFHSHLANYSQTDSDLKSTITKLEALKATLEQAIEEANNAALQAQTTADSAVVDIESLQSNDKTQDSNIQSIQSDVSSIQSNLDELTQKDEELDENVKQNSNQISLLQTSYQSLKSNSDKQGESITTIQGKVQNIESNNSNNDSRISSLESDVEQAKPTIAEHTASIGQLQSDIEATQILTADAQNDINDLTEKHNTLESTVSEHSASISKAEETIAAVKTTADKTGESVQTLIDTDMKHDQEIGSIQSQLEELNLAAAKLESLSQELLKKVNQSYVDEIITSTKSEFNELIASKADLSAIQNINDKLSEYAKTSEVETMLETKADKTEIEEIKSQLENKLEADALTNYMKRGQVNEAIDAKLREFEGPEKWNLQVLDTISDYVGKLYGSVGSVKFEGGTITAALADLQSRLKSVEDKQSATEAAVNNYTAVVKDFITPTEQS